MVYIPSNIRFTLRRIVQTLEISSFKNLEERERRRGDGSRKMKGKLNTGSSSSTLASYTLRALEGYRPRFFFFVTSLISHLPAVNINSTRVES